MLKEKIEMIKKEARSATERVVSLREIELLRVKYFGRNGDFNAILKSLKDLSDGEKRAVGKIANEGKKELEEIFSAKERELEVSGFNLESEKLDVTIPGKKTRLGHLHPLTLIRWEIEEIFISMGFAVADGPEIEKEFYNFDALNMPANHPARDMQDTFWLKTENKKDHTLLRTHTSNVQVRYMENHQPPFRIIAPGRIYRNEAIDSTHEHTFHQFEALVVGDDIHVGNFKFIAQEFFSKFFKKEIKIRIRPSYFPFTEPSFEFDISCTVCGGKGCGACKNAGWLEIGGAGMVNQNVFVAAGYPRGKYQGFAWGFGLERLAMMKYGIDDIRLFHGGDARFISQF